MTNINDIISAGHDLLEAQNQYKAAIENLRNCEARFNFLTGTNGSHVPAIANAEVVISSTPTPTKTRLSKGYAKLVMDTMKTNPTASFSYEDFKGIIPETSLPQTFGWLRRHNKIYGVGHKHFKVRQS